MITDETLFILGAGASVPYGYPTGKQLRRFICKTMNEKFYECFGVDPSNKKDPSIISMKSSFEKFSDKFNRSGRPSIDLFLATNPDFINIGKLSIIRSIWHYEKNSKFHEDIDDDKINQDWFTYLYQRMTEKLTQPGSHTKFRENKVSFITFNYDRCLEHMLFDNLISTFPHEDLGEYLRKPENDVIKLLPFPIIHIHGVIAPLQRGGSYYYTSDRIDQDDIHLVNNFKVIYEKGTENYEDAQKLINDADRIFFLGFGYADENLNILGIPGTCDHRQKIYGTAYGSTQKEIDAIRHKLLKPSFNYPDLQILNIDSYSLLREYL